MNSLLTDEGQAPEASAAHRYLYDFFMQTPAVLAILEGPQHIFKLTNPDYLKLVGKRNLVGKTVREAFPELKGQGFFELLDQVYQTGQNFVGTEMPVMLNKETGPEQNYINLNYQAFKNQQGQTTGILVFAYDVTEQVLARKTIQQSQQKLQVLFEQMDQGFCIIEVLFDEQNKANNWRFLEVNPAFAKQNGLTNAVGKTMLELVPQIEERWFRIYGNVALTGQPVRFVEGSEAMGRWFDLYAFRFGGEDSRQVAVFFTDITARKKAEEAHKEGEQQFMSLAENMPQLAWTANAEGYITWYNKRWYDYTGTLPEQMEGWGWQAVHDPQVLPRVMDRWKKSIESGSPFEMVFPLKSANGAFRQFLTRVIPLRNNAGKIIRWFGTNTDITDQKETELALRESEQRLKQLKDDLEAKVTYRNLELEQLNRQNQATIEALRKELAALKK